MSGQFGWNLDCHEGLDDVVGPVDMHNLQPHHHEAHKRVRQEKHVHLEFGKLFRDMKQCIHWRNNAYRHEQKYTASEPSDEPMHVEKVQKDLVWMLVFLTKNISTL